MPLSYPEISTQKLKKKNPAAVALGALGGRARRKKLTAEERSAIARKAGLAAGGEGRNKHQCQHLHGRGAHLIGGLRGIRADTLAALRRPYGNRDFPLADGVREAGGGGQGLARTGTAAWRRRQRLRFPNFEL